MAVFENIINSVVTFQQDVGTSPELITLPDNTPCQVDKCIDFVAVNQREEPLLVSCLVDGSPNLQLSGFTC